MSNATQIRLWESQSPGRRLIDLQINPLCDVSETLYKTSQKMHLEWIHAEWVILKTFSEIVLAFLPVENKTNILYGLLEIYF